MNGILLRVGCDKTRKGGRWNPPIDALSRDYVYVPIPEGDYHHICESPTYEEFDVKVRRLGVSMPSNLSPTTIVHLDPDFDTLSIGEPYKESRGLSSRGRKLNQLESGDFIVFYASFRPTSDYPYRLAYCLFGIFHIEVKTYVKDLSHEQTKLCAHGRRVGADNDLVIWADPNKSGRFPKAIPIGEFRNRAYRVRRDLLEMWGDLTVKDGYIQRSAIPPKFKQPERFLKWLNLRMPASSLLRQNY